MSYLDPKPSEILAEFKPFALLVTAVLLILIGAWVGMSAMEAAAFNRITGKHVSTWDAMWVELRVQEGPR